MVSHFCNKNNKIKLKNKVVQGKLRTGHVASGIFIEICQVVPTCTPTIIWFLGPIQTYFLNSISVSSVDTYFYLNIYLAITSWHA